MSNPIDSAYAAVTATFAQIFAEDKLAAVDTALRPMAEKIAPYSNYIIFGLAGAFAPCTLFYLASSEAYAYVLNDDILEINKAFQTSALKGRLDAMSLHKKIAGAFVAATVALAAYSFLPITLAIFARIAVTTGVGAYTGVLIFNTPSFYIPGVEHYTRHGLPLNERGRSAVDNDSPLDK